MRFVTVLFALALFFTGTARADSDTRLFKKGCGDFVAGRSTENAFYCVSVLNTALELIIIFQKEGGTKGLNICIPNKGLVTGDYAKLVNQHPDLMADNEPVSVGIIRIFAHLFPCIKR